LLLKFFLTIIYLKLKMFIGAFYGPDSAALWKRALLCHWVFFNFSLFEFVYATNLKNTPCFSMFDDMPMVSAIKCYAEIKILK
jgi:hypothetical protein